MREPIEKRVIASKGVTERSACRRLHDLAADVPAHHAIVELGAYLGRTTGWLVLGASRGHGAHVTAIDPWDTLGDGVVDADYAQVEPHYVDGAYRSAGEAWTRHALYARLFPRVTPLKATGAQVAAIWTQPIGLLFHDATHSADAVEADLRMWLPHIAAGGSIALHDLGQQAYGVEEGAGRVLDVAGWDWAGRERILWKKAPTRRGLLVVHRR